MLKQNIQFEINRDEGSTTTAKSDRLSVTVMGESRVFHRNGVKKHLKTGESEHVRYLVCELDGVRLYINGPELVMTKEDINP